MNRIYCFLLAMFLPIYLLAAPLYEGRFKGDATLITNLPPGAVMGSIKLTNSVSITNGHYITLYMTSGAILRSNTFAPFDWEFSQTNGVRTSGTNTVTKNTNDPSGTITAPLFNGPSTTSVTATNLENRGATGGTGHQASISTAGNNGINMTDADGSASSFLGSGMSVIWDSASAIPPLQFRDTNNVTFAIINRSGFFGGLTALDGTNGIVRVVRPDGRYTNMFGTLNVQLSNAQKRAVSGDTIYVAPGTYNVVVTNNNVGYFLAAGAVTTNVFANGTNTVDGFGTFVLSGSPSIADSYLTVRCKSFIMENGSQSGNVHITNHSETARVELNGGAAVLDSDSQYFEFGICEASGWLCHIRATQIYFNCDESGVNPGGSNSVFSAAIATVNTNVVNVDGDGAAFVTFEDAINLVWDIQHMMGCGVHFSSDPLHATRLVGDPNFSGGTISGYTLGSYQIEGVQYIGGGDGSHSNLVFIDIYGRLFPVTLGAGLTYNAATHSISAPTGGAGDMQAANNLSDVASPLAALGNIQGVSNHYGAALQFNSSLALSGTQTNLGTIYWKTYAAESGKTNIVFFDSAGHAFTNDLTAFIASLPSAGGSQTPITQDVDVSLFNFVRFNMTTWTNTGVSILARCVIDSINNGATLVIGALTNGVAGLSTLQVSNVFANTINVSGTATVDSADIGSVTGNATGLTNTVSWSNPGSTNLTLLFNGTIQTITLTNAPKDVFFHFLGTNGSISILCPTNTTPHFEYPVKWFLGMSNSVVTNGTIEADSYGGTNYGQLWLSIVEGM